MDERIIELFWNRDEQAIREAMEQYSAYCTTVASRILSDPEDVREAVCDTWMKAWDTIPPNRPTHLRLYLGRLTRNAALSIWRRNHAYCRGGGQTALALEELEQIASDSTPETELDVQELGHAVSAFLKTEPNNRRLVFLLRYFYMEDISTIARHRGLREANVRMMLSRTRQKLKKYLQKEGYII